jgi:hypothetical protein
MKIPGNFDKIYNESIVVSDDNARYTLHFDGCTYAEYSEIRIKEITGKYFFHNNEHIAGITVYIHWNENKITIGKTVLKKGYVELAKVDIINVTFKSMNRFLDLLSAYCEIVLFGLMNKNRLTV